MKKNVLLYSSIPEYQKKRLESHFNVMTFEPLSDQNKTEFLAALKTADGIIGSNGGFSVDETFLNNAPKLKAASTISVGFDNYNLPALAKHKVRLMNTPTVLTQGTADLIFTLLMATARRTAELSQYVREGKWTKSITSDLFGTDIYGKTVGIIGMGRIAKAIAKRAHCGFDMDILYYNRSSHLDVEKDYQAKRCELDDLLKQSDFVVIIIPLVKETEKLITKEKLELMKPSAILINGARGKVIDEKALIEALRNKTIRAAGLDVFETEPLPMSSELLKLDNVLLSPHVGSATIETRYAMAKCAVDNLIEALKDEKPSENWVNPEVG